MAMRVLVLNPYMSRRFAGASTASITIANGLARAEGLAVTAYAFVADDDVLDPSIELIRGEPLRQPRFFWRFPSIYMVSAMQRELASRALPPVDVCYTRHTSMGLAYRRLFPETPVLSHTGAVLADREYRDESGRPYWEAAVEGWLVNRLERQLYAEPRWVHLVSTRLVAVQRERHYGLRSGFFGVQPLPVDQSRFHPGVSGDGVRERLGVPGGAFLVVAVARLTRWKNMDFLLRAIAATEDDVHLAIVGEGPEADALRDAAVILGIAPRVVFTGHENPAPILAAADLFVLPSLLESFGLAYAEAMVMGLPCIGMRNEPPTVLSTAQDVIPVGTGYCVSTVDELAARIRGLAANRPLAQRMGEAARRHAEERYSVAAYVGRVAGELERLAGIRPS
jgi:glycosyltransferase involved in cell wall biosynthesis